MGLVRTSLTLSNARAPESAPMVVEALVDTGAVHLRIPETVSIQLALEELETREVTSADGSKRLVSSIGPVETAFGNRSCYTGAMVMGDEILLGAIPMEGMDLVVRPSSQDVVPNPKSPNIPASVAMGVRYR